MITTRRGFLMDTKNQGLNFRFVPDKLSDGSWVWELRGERNQLIIKSVRRFKNKRDAHEAAKNFRLNVLDATIDFG